MAHLLEISASFLRSVEYGTHRIILYYTMVSRSLLEQEPLRAEKGNREK